MTRRYLISPTAFKGTLRPTQAAAIMARAVRKSDPRASLRILPLADGGDGTLDVLSSAFHAGPVRTPVTGPLGEKINASWSQFEKTAVIEMARASGLALVKGRNKIRQATTYGTGELIRAALERGCRRIFIGVGGTATSDGGAGALQALGLRYFDETKRELLSRPADLIRLHEVDWKHFDPRIRRVKIFVLCDVTNPLLGSRGSARIFGPQKGASSLDVLFLEKVMRRWSRFAMIPSASEPGAGAAGGLAFGLAGFAGARLVKGAPFIMKAVHWTAAARHADLILTGEGRLDPTSFSGKVVGEIVKNKGRAKVLVACGSTTFSNAELFKKGVSAVARMGSAGRRNPASALMKTCHQLLKHLPPKI